MTFRLFSCTFAFLNRTFLRRILNYDASLCCEEFQRAVKVIKSYNLAAILEKSVSSEYPE